MFFKRKRRLEARVTALERMQTVKSWCYGEIGLLDLVRAVERLEKELEMVKKIKAASGKGKPQEIAALVLAVQGRHSEPTQVKIELDHKRVAQSVFEATRDTNEA